jgi:hypothetical protein
MMRISLDSPALIAIRTWLAGTAERAGRSGRREASRLTFRTEQLEPRTMLDGGMLAQLPNLVAASDTGASNTDNLTYDRTPDLKGIVQGPASEVRLRIDGQRVAVVPVVSGKWTYTVPAEAALAAGKHKIEVRPVDAQGKPGTLSKPLEVTIRTALPTAPTLGLGAQSDSGVKGDGQTTYATPTFRGVAQPGRLVNVSIDGEFVGQVKSDAKTGAWLLKSPRLANGTHDVTAVVENRVGLPSAPTSLQVTVNGLRTVMLDATGGQSVELTAAHLLGQGSQGFIVTEVHRGTLQKWSAAKNEWLPIPGRAMTGTDPASLQKAAAIRKVSPTDVVRWTPASGDVGNTVVFALCPSDIAGGPTAPTPEPGTVPGQLVNALIAPLQGGIGQTITWDDPTDGCGCPSTRYSIEVTREDGRTLVYNVPRTVNGIPIVEGGTVQQVKVWGATKTGAGVARSYDAVADAKSLSRLTYTVTSGTSFVGLGDQARAQLAITPTPTQFTTNLPLGGTHADLAYLEVQALPDATEAALGLSAGSRMIISSDSSKLTPAQRGELKANPVYARHLFPGTVNGEVQPDQVRAHFQAGERLRFSGAVDARVRTGATIVVESAQNLGDGSLGPWFEEARISVGADGGYSHDYVVPYGMNSVRTRLEYRTQPAAPAMRSASEPTLGATSSTSTPIDLSSSFNAFGITTAPWQAPNSQGFDRNGNYYNSDYNGSGTDNPIPATPITYKGITFPLGPIPTKDGQVGGSGNSPSHNPPNFVQAKGQTITVSVDADKSDYLYLAGAASNGNQTSQKIVLNFTDGSTETWTQSFHDWASVGPPQQGASTSANHALLPVIAVATSSITTTGLQTIDGVTLAANDRVLLQNQTNAADNGVYIAQAGAWSRANDANSGTDILGAYTNVTSGTTYAGKTFINTNTGTIDLGSTAITFVEDTPPTPAPRPYAGELLLKTQPERINQQGDLVTTPAHVFAYCYNLKGKQLASITLPNNDDVGILSAVVAKAPVIALDEGIASVVLGTTNLTGIDVMALTIANESNIGAGGGPLTFFFADQPEKGSTSSVALSSIATTGGISRDGQSFSGGGFDGDGNAYSWEALGSSRILRGTSVTFDLGLPGQPNFVVANGQTIEVPQGSSYTTLNLAGAAVNGGQENQPITLTFTDNSTAVWTQSFSDWCNPQNYSGEATIATASYRDNASGETNQTTNHIYQYSYTIPSGKTLKSITLPTNSDVRLLDIQITPPTYTTKQVTVPMGQQTTIAYIAPDSSSQMTFYVQKADGTCVGPNCSTYLTNWNGGSGKSDDWAANISPSLNSQIKAGQHWTMTVQNAGMGYYGYLDSPSGQKLPSASGNTPAGAQFRLETQTEINVQPPWAVAVEATIGTLIVLVGIGLATGGTGDVALAVGEGAADAAVDVGAGDATADVAVGGAAETAETVAVDPLTYEYAGDLTLSGEFAQASYIAGDGDSFSVRRIITGISRLPAYF